MGNVFEEEKKKVRTILQMFSLRTLNLAFVIRAERETVYKRKFNRYKQKK